MKFPFPVVVLAVLIARCGQAAGLPTQNAVTVPLPMPVVVDEIHHSMTLAPVLEIRNRSADTLGVVHVGGDRLNNVVFEYEVFDPSGKKLPAVRTDSTVSTLVAHRVWVSLLKPGEAMKWIPLDVPTYAVTSKGKYQLIVHAEFSAPDPGYEVGMTDTDRQQISATVHRFDLDPVVFTVD